MDEVYLEGETTLANSSLEGSAESCRSKSSKTDITIKPCKVLLRNIFCELKPSHKYCLIPPKTKKLSQKTRNAKKIVHSKMLQVVLCDLLDRHCIKITGNHPNPATLPESKKVNKMDNDLVLNNSAKILSKETKSANDIKKAERVASFPDISMLCDNILSKFYSIKSNLENSATGSCRAEENKKEAKHLQEDPIPLPETQSTVSFEPTKECMEHGKTLIEQTERKESSRRTDLPGSKYSGETSIDSTSQPSRINKIPISDSCSFELEGNGTVNIGVPICATCEENMFQKMQNGDHSSEVSLSECQSFPDDVANIKHTEARQETVLNDREISNAEERGNSQPAEEGLAGEEDQLLLRQSHGVQTVFYEFSDSTVKLLGTPKNSSVMLDLDRLIELEDSSDSKEGQGSSTSLIKENQGSPYSTELTWHQSLYSDDTTARKRSSRRQIISSKLSEEESRIKVINALREVLQKRLDDSPDLSVQENTVLRIAKKVEKALFNLSCCVDQHYKNKYRSLLFNLKSARNQQLFCKVILGVISPKRLVQMNALELAPEDLAEWRASKRKHALEVIEKEEREAPRCCLTKFTHKGIIEIDRDTDEDLMFQEISGSQLPEDENSHLEAPAASMKDSRNNHKSHMSDFDCLRDTGQMAADSEGGFKPPTYKCILKQKTNVSKYLQSNTIYSGGGERRFQEDRAISSSFPKKHLQVGNQARISVIWKGLIQMFSLKRFAAKAYPVSGSGYHLFQTLPDLLQSRGCILPEDVWAYFDSIWPAKTKEMALIKFHPSLTKGCSPYNMLYSYLNNKQRYGIVDNNHMEMFMVPLAAYQPVPSKLHPLGGPGLDASHPSLLLGLILPKRPPTGPGPLPKPKRKNVTFKDSIEIQYFPLPSQVDAHQHQPPQPLSPNEPLWERDCLALVLPWCEPLLSEKSVSKMVHGALSSFHQETAGDETSQSLSDVILQLQCDSSLIEGQLGNLTLETLGVQSQQAEICTNPGPLHLRNPLGLLLPSETVRPNHHGVDGTHGADLLDTSHLLNMLCPEPVPPAEASEAPLPPLIPSAAPVARDSNSLMKDTLSLIHYVTQLQSNIIPDQEPPPGPPSLLHPFSTMPPETASALSPIVAGLEVPAVQQSDDEVYAQLQLLLSLLGGLAQPPST
ncbi:SPOC domain-containing protein 1 [Heteronotia binoei]|uniref:SPOC domain-containing protein 1 n=1 Tax=Heteronotia binoei TaxID=13085 RepID=UPI002930B233|nr:SPOC domain-containing protein 1 [Heteronotia binoei]